MSGLAGSSGVLVYVDGDETLFHRKDYNAGDKKPGNPAAVKLICDGEIYFVTPRPSARRFLESLQTHGKPDMITSGSVEFQALVLRTLGLRDLIGEIHGNVRLGGNSTPLQQPSNKVILIDDLSPKHDGAQAKLRKLGQDNGVQIIYLQCQKYFGTTTDPEPLTDLLPRIAQAMG